MTWREHFLRDASYFLAGCGKSPVAQPILAVCRCNSNGFNKGKEALAVNTIPDRLFPQPARSSFEDYGFPGNTFDLVTAQYSLPFIQATNFKAVFTKIKRSLVVDGVFTGQFFGDRDEWNGPQRTLTFLPRQEVVGLLADMEILELAEEEGNYPTVTSKQLKHWHLFHFIAKK